MTAQDKSQKEKLDTFLEELIEKENLSGVIFSTIDGHAINVKIKKEILNQEYNEQEFTAMCASVLGSSKGIAELLDEENTKQIVAELNNYIMMVFLCDINTFLIILFEKNAVINNFLRKKDQIIEKISNLY